MSGRKMTTLICNDSTMHSIINELIMSKTSPFNIQFVCKNLITVDLAKKTCTVCIVFLPKLNILSIQNRSWNYVKKMKGN